MQAVQEASVGARKGLALVLALPHPLAAISDGTWGVDRSERRLPPFPSGFIRGSTRAGEGAAWEGAGAGFACSITPGLSTR